MLSLGLFPALVAVAVALRVLVNPIVEYLQDPLDLRKYPAPSFLASCSSLWLSYATWTQRRSEIIHKQHCRLGDVIRVSPNHLMFNDPRAIKDIYGVLAVSRGTFKDDFYDRLAGDFHDLVQLRDRAEHSDRRKALANAFALKTVTNMESQIRGTFALLLARIEAEVDEHDASTDVGATLNIRQWLNYFTLDVIGDMGFGLPMGFLQSGTDTKAAQTQSGKVYVVDSTIEALHQGVRYSLTVAQTRSLFLNRLVKQMVSRLAPLASASGSKASLDFENICVHQLRNRMDIGAPPRPSGDFMGFVLGERPPKSDAGTGAGERAPTRAHNTPTFRKLVADASMMMNAGSDTTAAGLSSTIYFLLANPPCLAKLRTELDDVCARRHKVDPGDSLEEKIFFYDEVNDLPYLRACVDEALRLRPPIAYQLPRVVSNPAGAEIAGRHVRAGTVVAVPPYSVHRHKSVFKEPETYNPSRWLDFDPEFPEQRQDLRSYNIVFSQGSRACIGRHIAVVELLVVVSTLLFHYDVELAEGLSQELQIFERFNSNPGPLPVRIKRRRNV